MQFEESNSKTVISTAVTITNNKSSYNNKTADECTQEELINQIFLQLKEAYKDLPYPTDTVISPSVKYNNYNKKWETEDTAFITTSNEGYLPFKNDIITNMYNLGTHNGKSYYKFTSLESAVSNAVILSKNIYPELNNKQYIKLNKLTSLSDVINLLIIILIIYLIYKTTK